MFENDLYWVISSQDPKTKVMGKVQRLSKTRRKTEVSRVGIK